MVHWANGSDILDLVAIIPNLLTITLTVGLDSLIYQLQSHGQIGMDSACRVINQEDSITSGVHRQIVRENRSVERLYHSIASRSSEAIML